MLLEHSLPVLTALYTTPHPCLNSLFKAKLGSLPEWGERDMHAPQL
jgi:hypothetical protein